MDNSDRTRIYIPRRPRLGLDRPAYRWRIAGWLGAACAAMCGVVWLVLR